MSAHMTVKDRVIQCRMIEKILKNVSYSKQLGLEIEGCKTTQQSAEKEKQPQMKSVK